MTLSFILPFTFKERITKQTLWRVNPDLGAETRLNLLLRTFSTFFRQEDLAQFLIISPERDLLRVENILRGVTLDVRYTVISEKRFLLFDDLQPADADSLAGWYTQQLIKMAACHHVPSSFYVTLDSDVVCLRSFGAEDLIECVNGCCKGLLNIETTHDYRGIYTKRFVDLELAIKRERYVASLSLLGYDGRHENMSTFFGETPCVIHKASMSELLRYIEVRIRLPWQKCLVASRGWTEYSLYFQYLQIEGQLSKIHSLAGCNRVLDLERSVWQADECYALDRCYDRAHFTRARHEKERGPFVAIQSWLPIDSWLPSRYQSIVEFYNELASWLLGAG